MNDIRRILDRVKGLDAAMPPGVWEHSRYRNENGWWSTLVQVRQDGPPADRVLTLLTTIVPNQDKGGDVVTYCTESRKLLPHLATLCEQLQAERDALRERLARFELVAAKAAAMCDVALGMTTESEDFKLAAADVLTDLAILAPNAPTPS